jgi:hypothetical protein
VALTEIAAPRGHPLCPFGEHASLEIDRSSLEDVYIQLPEEIAGFEPGPSSL